MSKHISLTCVRQDLKKKRLFEVHFPSRHFALINYASGSYKKDLRSLFIVTTINFPICSRDITCSYQIRMSVKIQLTLIRCYS